MTSEAQRWSAPRLGVALAALLFAAWAAAQPESVAAQAAPAPYVMPSTQVWDMSSESGEIYRILVSAPALPYSCSWDL